MNKNNKERKKVGVLFVTRTIDQPSDFFVLKNGVAWENQISTHTKNQRIDNRNAFACKVNISKSSLNYSFETGIMIKLSKSRFRLNNYGYQTNPYQACIITLDKRTGCSACSFFPHSLFLSDINASVSLHK